VGAPHASVWWATLQDQPAARAPLDGDLDVDVAIVGAGFTGLWTAKALLDHDPTMRVAVLEATVAGAGASGRNGGWASALYPLSFARVRSLSGDDQMRSLRRALREGVTSIADEAAASGIEFDYQRGGTVTLARTELQASQLQAELDEATSLGDGPDDLQWLDAEAASARCAASDVVGGLYTPHCAAVHPAKLVTGLAAVVEQLGGSIYEGTPVTAIEPGDRWRRARAVTASGSVRADVVVRATEGFTPSLASARRAVVPLYSLVVATDRLDVSFFERIGLGDRETFNDARHLIIYGQRTADDRVVLGGRGAPYHFGSRVDARFDDVPSVFDKLEATLHELFGDVPGRVAFRWGGPLAMARDQAPSVRFDADSGMASAGGYVGDGVVLSRIAAHALADLITGVDSALTRLPFVGHRARDWEPEPLRWLGINGGLMAASIADRREAATGRASMAATVLARLQGH
jgi:glycine/D-amino acid oxidase-like deaminating enzyme